MSDVTLGTIYQQGQSNAIIAWTYVDDSDGSIIVPDSFGTNTLEDPSDVQRDPTDTAQTTAGSFTPTLDADGTTTGTTNAHYLTVNFDNDAEVGLWEISTTFEWESKTKTQTICFNVVESGASVGGSSPVSTTTVYAHPLDVANLLQLDTTIDEWSTPTIDQVYSYISMAEGEFERVTGTAYKPVLVTDEVKDIEAWRSRYREFYHWDALTARRPFYLNHRPTIPFDSSRGHSIEVYEGTETDTTSSDPVGEWTDYTTSKTYGRDNDYWVDHEKGILYIRKAFLPRQAQGVRITYEYGKPITTTTSSLTVDTTTINVNSTYRYSTRGVIRVGDEYIFHTGKTATSFTGCVRGQFGSEKQTHAINSEVYEVPYNIRRLVTQKTAAMLLRNDRFVAVMGDGQLSSSELNANVEAWEKDWKEALHNDYQQWRLI